MWVHATFVSFCNMYLRLHFIGAFYWHTPSSSHLNGVMCTEYVNLVVFKFDIWPLCMCACVCCHTVQTNMSILIWNMLVWNKWLVNACMWIYTACMCWALCARIQTECSSAYSKEGDRGVGEGGRHIFTYVCTRGPAQNQKLKIWAEFHTFFPFE